VKIGQGTAGVLNPNLAAGILAPEMGVETRVRRRKVVEKNLSPG